MSNQLYPKAKEGFLSAAINIPTDNLKVVLVDTGTYTYSASHQFLTDIGAPARIATSGNLAGKTVVNGVFDANDITITAVSGLSIEALVIYQDTGSAATSRLLLYMDTGVTGLPLTPNSGDVAIVWNASGIAAL